MHDKGLNWQLARKICYLIDGYLILVVYRGRLNSVSCGITVE